MNSEVKRERFSVLFFLTSRVHSFLLNFEVKLVFKATIKFPKQPKMTNNLSSMTEI